MAISFGVTVLPDPPYTRFLELIELAEQQGFEYGWTYDSHVLWQEAIPLLTLAAERTSTMKLGHFVTNPGTREPTVLASAYATMHVHLGRPDGDGDRPRRLGAARDRPAAGEDGRVRDVVPDDPRPHERPRGHLERQGAEARVGADRAGDPAVRRGLRPEGARRRGPRLGRRDHPARRPGDRRVDHVDRPGVGREGRPRPRRARVHRRRAVEGRRRPRRDPRGGAVVPRDGLEPRHGPDRALRLGLRHPVGADRLRQDAEGLRLQGPLAGRRRARRVRHRRDLRPLLRDRRRRARARRSCASSRRSASTSSTCT